MSRRQRSPLCRLAHALWAVALVVLMSATASADRPKPEVPADLRPPAEPATPGTSTAQPALAIQGPGPPFGAEPPIGRFGPWPRRTKVDMPVRLIVER